MVLTVGVNTVQCINGMTALLWITCHSCILDYMKNFMSKNWNEMYTCDSSESYQYHTCASIEIEVKTQPEDATNFR